MGKGKGGGIINVLDPATNELASTEISVELINQYFSNIGRSHDDNLPSGLGLGTMIATDCTFDIVPDITVEEVLELIENIDIV